MKDAQRGLQGTQWLLQWIINSGERKSFTSGPKCGVRGWPPSLKVSNYDQLLFYNTFMIGTNFLLLPGFVLASSVLCIYIATKFKVNAISALLIRSIQYNPNRETHTFQSILDSIQCGHNQFIFPVGETLSVEGGPADYIKSFTLKQSLVVSKQVATVERQDPLLTGRNRQQYERLSAGTNAKKKNMEEQVQEYFLWEEKPKHTVKTSSFLSNSNQRAHSY
ncbi:hypothetical protein GOODEAATRI_014400 [Goodea atripinnis]|uniref:Uncharacterized protein n=1 Tax=Goodea atripinnis TaxID=208336 RepID=A0ABV0NAL5_9TELE